MATRKIYSPTPTQNEDFGNWSNTTNPDRGMDADGDWLAVGGELGEIHLYHKEMGAWVWKQTLDDGGSALNYGNTLAISISADGLTGTLLAGEIGYDSSKGRVWVYVLASGTWSQQGSPLQPTGVAAGDKFGFALTVDHGNNECFIASPMKHGPSWLDQGYIYHWTRSGSTWTEGSNYTLSDPTANNHLFGASLQMASGHMIVGTMWNHKAYYWADDSGWTEKQILDKVSAYFGESVALSRPNADYIVVGWPNRDGNRGGAVTYTRSGFVLTERDLIHESTEGGGIVHLGVSTVMDSQGNVLLGGPDWTEGAVASTGIALYFARDGNSWGDANNHETTRYLGTGNANDDFGATVAITDTDHFVAEPFNDDYAFASGVVFNFFDYPIPTVDPATISTAGGHKITLTGSFPEGTAVQAFLGPNGDETDEPCYSGEPGNAYAPVSLDGETLEIVSPPMSKGNRTITIRYGGDNYTDWGVTVVERHWPSVLFNARRNHPPWKGVGARRLELEDLDV